MKKLLFLNLVFLMGCASKEGVQFHFGPNPNDKIAQIKIEIILDTEEK